MCPCKDGLTRGLLNSICHFTAGLFHEALHRHLFLHHQQLPHIINVPFSAPSMNMPLQGRNEPPSLAKAGPLGSTEGYPQRLAKLEVTSRIKAVDGWIRCACGCARTSPAAGDEKQHSSLAGHRVTLCRPCHACLGNAIRPARDRRRQGKVNTA